MKTSHVISGLFLLLFSSCFFCRHNVFPNDDFYNDLASENNRIWGELSLDVFDDNLDSLTYEFYIKYLDEHRMPSAEDLAEQIKNADQYYFDSTPQTFVIVLYYKEPAIIVGDNAESTRPDTVITLSNTDDIPDLSQLAEYLEN